MATQETHHRTRWLRPLLPLLLLLLLPGLAAAEETTDPAVVPGADGGKAEPAVENETRVEAPVVEDAGQGGDLAWEFAGYVRGLARYRHAGSESDLDIRANVVADATYRSDLTVNFRVNGLLHWDAYGNADRGDLLYDYWDTFTSEFRGRLFEAYAETKGLMDGVIGLRAGRQFFFESVPFQLDGLRVDADLGKVLEGLDVSVFGGLVVFDDESSRKGSDWVAGVVARYRPRPGTTLRLEYYHVSEDFDGINDPVVDPINQPFSYDDENLEDDYWGLTVWHRIDRRFSAYGRVSLLEGKLNEHQLRGRFQSEDGVWTASLEYYHMHERLRNVTNDISPFVPLLGTYQPFWRVGGRVGFRPDDEWLVVAGYSHRELEDSDDEGQLNHTYDHYLLTATGFGLLDPALDLTIAVNGYSASDKTDTVALGGNADYRLTPEVTLAGGIDYSYFKYFYLEDTEREHVWTYWLDARWRFSPTLDLRGRASLDQDKDHTYTTFEVIVTVRF